MWSYILVLIIRRVSKDHSAFETSESILPMTQRIIPEDISSAAVSSLNLAFSYVISPPWLSYTLGQVCEILCFADRASLYNLVNKTNLVHNLFLVYLSVSTCIGQLWVRHQEKQLWFCDTRYFLFIVDDCLIWRSICSCISDSNPQSSY